MVLTNAAPLGPYRGAGRPEAIYLIERLIDGAARAMEHRPRRAAAPQPHSRRRRCRTSTPNGPVYDSGDFAAVLDKALALADWNGFARAARGFAQRAGKLRGIGIGCFLEVAGGILDETADLRFEADGKVALRHRRAGDGAGASIDLRAAGGASGSASPMSAVRLVQGDSDEVPAGTPSVASRSMMMAGSATALACDEAIEKGRRGARAPVRGRRRRRRVLRRAVPRGRHRPRDPDPRARRSAARRGDCRRNLPAASTPSAKFVSPQMSFPERLPRLRGRDRSGYRRGRGGRLRGGRRRRQRAATRPSWKGRSTAASRRASARCWASRWSTATTASC